MIYDNPLTGTLLDAKAWLRERVTEGAHCPCCNQFAKVYRRRINSGMARSLISIYTLAGMEWTHVPTAISARSREEGKLAYWGLAEESAEPREDGGRAGWWRITPKGKAFVTGLASVPSHARIYDGQCLSLVGKPTSIRDALGNKFDYDALMHGDG